jgi:hypothetical protein
MKVNGQLRALAALTSEETTKGIHCRGGRVCHRDRLDAWSLGEKQLPQSGIEPDTLGVKLVA